jgi:hypothetical protein
VKVSGYLLGGAIAWNPGMAMHRKNPRRVLAALRLLLSAT